MSLNKYRKYKKSEYAPHRAELEAAQLSLAEAIDFRDYELLTPIEMKRRTGIKGNAILMPTASSDDETIAHDRYKLLDEAVRTALGRKYHQPSDSGVRIHFGRFPPSIKRKWKRRKAKRLYLITEGEKKADEAGRHGLYCISVPGVSAWRGPDGLHPDLIDGINFRGATFEFFYDTDQNTKPQVWREQLAMADALKAHAKAIGVRIRIKFGSLYPVPNESKTGLDDFILHYGIEALKTVPRHDFKSEYVDDWRKKFEKDTGTLPAVLRNLQPVPAEWWDKTLPDPVYIVQNYLQEQENAIVAGQGGTGKTFWLLYMMAAITSGTDFFGYPTYKARKAMYLSLERNENNFRRRWKKVMTAVAGDLAAGPKTKFIASIKQNCYVKTLAGESIPLIEFKDNQWQPTPMVDALIEELKAAGIEVVFLDPYSRLHGADENSSSVASAITKALERIQDGARCSVVLCHHTGKVVGQGQNAPRGSSALVDNTSQTMVITKMACDVAADALNLDALTEEERKDRAEIVVVEHPRASDGPTARTMHFVRQPSGLLRLISVSKISLDDRLTSIFDSDCAVCEWAKGKNKLFTKSAFVKDRKTIFGPGVKNISERVAEQAFDCLVKDGAFRPAKKGGEHRTRNRGLLYKIAKDKLPDANTGSEAAVGRTTASVAKTGVKKAKDGAEKHA